jgi:DNA-binding MarR family transcriptional regulator
MSYSGLMPVRTDTSPIASELRVVLGQVMRRLRAEPGFPLTQGAVLGRLDRQGPQTTVALAAAERVRPQSMGQTLAELESHGLISRRPDESDGRRTLLDLTPEGRRALAQDRQRREGWLAQAMERGFTPEEQEVLANAIPLLARLTEL